MNALSCTALCKAYALLRQISEPLLYQKNGEFPNVTMGKCLRTSWMRCSIQPKLTLLIHSKMLTDNGHKEVLAEVVSTSLGDATQQCQQH